MNNTWNPKHFSVHGALACDPLRQWKLPCSLLLAVVIDWHISGNQRLCDLHFSLLCWKKTAR